jgi:hypothetical protein
MNGDKVLKLSTTHSDDDALNKAKTLIKDVIAGQEHVLFTDLDEPENDTEYTLEYSEALANQLLDEIKKPQYTNQLILTEVIVGVEDDGISTYEKATKTLAAPPGFDDTSADYDNILNELNSSSQAKPKKRRKKKKDPFNLGSKSDDIGDQISELSDYQAKQSNTSSAQNDESEPSQSNQESQETNDKDENDLVHDLVNSLVPSKDDITEKLNPNLDVDADDETKSFGNTHASSLLAVYNIAKPHIRKIEKEDLDSQLEEFKKEIANRPPSVINDLIEANDKRVQFANEVHDQTEHIRNERENQRQEYVDAKLKEAEEQIRNQFEYEYPDNTEDKISEYLQSVKDDLDQYSADFENKRSEAHSQLMDEFKKRQNDDSLNEVFDFLEQKATISGYAQDDIDNAYKRQGIYDLEEEDDDFDFDDDFEPDESLNSNGSEQVEQIEQVSESAEDDGLVDIDKMMAQQPNEYTDDHDESEPVNNSEDNQTPESDENESDFEDDDDPFGDAFDDDDDSTDDDESLPDDIDMFDDDPVLNEEVNEDTQDDNPNQGDEFIEPQSEYQNDDDEEDDLLTEDVDEDKDIDSNIITASRANSTLNDDIENDKTEMADDYESTTLQDDDSENETLAANDKNDSEKENASKDNKKDTKETPSAIEILKLDKISKKTRKLIMIILASIVIIGGIGAVTTSIIISNNDAHQEAKQKEEKKKEMAKKKRLDEIAKYMKGKKMRVVDKESQNRVVFTVTDITEKGGAKGHYYKTKDGDREKVEKYMSPEVVKDYVDRLKQQEKENEE